MTREDIEVFKRADEYTEEELAVLPKVPNNKTDEGRSVWIWTGSCWEFAPVD